MQRLSNPAYLVPTSQSSGGEVHDNALAMTAPGSPGVTPAPVGLVETLPLPVDSGGQIPVSDQSGRIRGNDGRFTESDSAWAQPGYMDEGASDGAGWRQT
jgi:hypothetical protein